RCQCARLSLHSFPTRRSSDLTDVRTLHALMRATIDQAGIDSMIHVAGYVPWRYKYTDVNVNGWNAGGTRDGVATEWKCTEILSRSEEHTSELQSRENLVCRLL